MDALNEAVTEATIRILREQRDALLLENARLKKQLAAWPGRAIEHALDARERERRKLGALLP